MALVKDLVMRDIDTRKVSLRNWLERTCQIAISSFIPMMGDASFRRYFRVTANNQSYIAMDAPPHLENCAPFVAIANALRSHRVLAPEIFYADLEQGFLLISDFGHHTYLKALTAENADKLYRLALATLATIQACHDVPDRIIPPFTADFMWQEWGDHTNWFLDRFLKVEWAQHENALHDCYSAIVKSAIEQPQVFMHRDYHAGNLMVVKDGKYIAAGVLDFQDAFIGPVTYDLVSLLRDCYIAWPDALVEQWAHYYWELLQEQGVTNAPFTTFMRWFDLMGIQRHLKALLTFARKAERDQQFDYLQHMPRTLHYILSVSAKYPELSALHDFYAQQVEPALIGALQ